MQQSSLLSVTRQAKIILSLTKQYFLLMGKLSLKMYIQCRYKRVTMGCPLPVYRSTKNVRSSVPPDPRKQSHYIPQYHQQPLNQWHNVTSVLQYRLTHENKTTTFINTTGNHSTSDTLSHHRRPESSATLLREPQTSYSSMLTDVILEIVPWSYRSFVANLSNKTRTCRLH